MPVNINSIEVLTDLREQDRSAKLVESFVNYLFWFLVILYTNPGAIVQALHIYYITDKINIGDLLFVLLSFCYFINQNEYTVFDIDFIKVRKFLLIFLVYYLVVFSVITPIWNGNLDYTLSDSIIKTRYTVYAILISIYIYDFFKKSWDIFLKVFLYSSILVSILFILTVVLKIDILPLGSLNRGYINVDRKLMLSEGLLPLLLPLGITVAVFNYRIKYRNLILIGFGLMCVVYVLELWRRNIAAIFIFFILAAILNAIINRKFIILFKNAFKIIFLLTFLTLISYSIFPRYIDAAILGIKDSFSVLRSEHDLRGKKDVRMTLDRPFINKKFYEHPFFGTGFDNRWRTKGGDNQGFEAADYPFLSALAMFGIVGLLVFIPLYIMIIKVLRLDFKYLKSNSKRIEKTLLLSFVITFMLYFTSDIMQYFNYFQAVSNSDFYYNWYIFLSLYLAARSQFYSSEFEYKEQNNLLFEKN